MMVTGARRRRPERSRAGVESFFCRTPSSRAPTMRKTTVGSVLLAFLALAGHASARGGMPDSTTARGRLIEEIYFEIFVAGVIVFLIVMGLLVWVIVRYRASSGVGKATFERERENLKLELTWIIIPLAVVLWVGGISYAGLVELDEGTIVDDAYTEIRIIGSQWNWEANYGAGVSVFADPNPNTGEVGDDNVFVLPADVPVAFNVTAIDVIHAFAIQEYDPDTDRLGTQLGMVDANPTGPHRFNHMVVEFTEGEYRIQCKEMCFNPGHAYMRARIQAVPVEEYENWLEQRQLEVGAELIERIGLQVTDGSMTTEREDITVANGARLIVQVANDQDQEATVSIAGTNASVTVGARDFGTLVYNTTTAGDFQFEASTGGNVSFTVIDAELVEFELGDFFIDPVSLTLEPGTTYLFQATNVGAVVHNLFVGAYDGEGDADVRWNSATVGPGNTASFIVTPEEPMRFDTWCNVAGHYGEGMYGALTIA